MHLQQFELSGICDADEHIYFGTFDWLVDMLSFSDTDE